NTMHKVADEVETSIDIPLLHIADATARDILDMGITKVGLLGTSYTMEQDFYKERIGTLFGIDVITPEPDNRQIIDNIIYNELCQGKYHEASRAKFRKVMASLVEEGAEGIILGCTEIPLLVGDGDSSVPLFNTTRIHALKAVDLALG
ncbi:MAG: amino acid racemase, partial [Thermoplasmata archaeon]|nr:amino acid racemase [Thermoplasmata archaeon]